jgi:hypothetical protein
MPITITDAALERVLEVRAREHEPEGLALWVEIVGVAGAAYQYDMSFLRHDEIDETDVVVTSCGLQVVVPQPGPAAAGAARAARRCGGPRAPGAGAAGEPGDRVARRPRRAGGGRR